METDIYNIYAPNGFCQDKIDFFESIFDKIADYNGDTIIGGDFNTTLGTEDRHNRGVTAAELRTAQLLKNNLDEYDFTDAWAGVEGFTWRRVKSCLN